MNAFDHYQGQMATFLAELRQCPSRTREAHSPFPNEAGVYVFYEGRKAKYVGQARSLNQRLGQQTRPSSKRNQASFAFRCAYLDKFKKCYHEDDLQTRKSKVKSWADFEPYFTAAKDRVRGMNIKYLVMKDAKYGTTPFERGVVRSMLEIYLAAELGTECFNSFETH